MDRLQRGTRDRGEAECGAEAIHPFEILLFVAREVVSLGLMQRLSGEGVDPMSFGPLPLGLTVRSILEGRE